MSARKAMEQHLHLAESAQVRESAPHPHNGARSRTGTKGSTAETVGEKNSAGTYLTTLQGKLNSRALSN